MTPAIQDVQRSQAAWAQALLDPQLGAPTGLRSWNGSDPAQRFALHRNNVVLGLSEALGEAFPVLRAHVGATAFEVLAREFLRDHPPASPVLSDWGDELAGWIERYAPAAAWPWLADLARLERARVRLYHAADASALPESAIAARLAQPHRLSAARLTWHPGAAVYQSRWACVSLWAAHQGAGAWADLDIQQGEAALLLRQGDELQVLPLPPAQAAVLAALARGQTLGEAARHAEETQEGEAATLAACLTLLLRQGLITAWHDPG
ncbi:DNA-binding domain-containing protein [Sphaerotilus microaerophilus]|uniref:DUF2063 domain-containing protein n=1 Tax=Sphaerotilus microaerophilus TaxID=2914710 RepID=A0ABN6PQV0_9BURK|nr:DNA-binding domain-containing protein [Sphaerotilus sp. FB-5]BDI06457.1 DUF2063 domain-containing protein [Sphaerotilus sp. FB-5]